MGDIKEDELLTILDNDYDIDLNLLYKRVDISSIDKLYSKIFIASLKRAWKIGLELLENLDHEINIDSYDENYYFITEELYRYGYDNIRVLFCKYVHKFKDIVREHIIRCLFHKKYMPIEIIKVYPIVFQQRMSVNFYRLLEIKNRDIAKYNIIMDEVIFKDRHYYMFRLLRDLDHPNYEPTDEDMELFWTIVGV